jgi:hypothetical protein
MTRRNFLKFVGTSIALTSLNLNLPLYNGKELFTESVEITSNTTYKNKIFYLAHTIRMESIHNVLFDNCAFHYIGKRGDFIASADEHCYNIVFDGCTFRREDSYETI